MTNHQKLNSVNIKAIGKWNPFIFQPDWLVNLISPKISDKKDSVEVLLNVQDRELGFSFKGIKIFPRSNELELVILGDEANNHTMILLVKLLNQVLETLPQTPIVAIGFNFNITIKQESNLGIVNWIRTQKNMYNNLEISQYILTKKFEDHILNLICSFPSNDLVLNFNFHFDKIPKKFNNDLLIIFNKVVEEYLS